MKIPNRDRRLLILIFGSILSLIVLLILAVYVFPYERQTKKITLKTTTSPTSPTSPVSAGIGFRVFVAANPQVTFNYVNDPQIDGSTGYLSYNNRKNMLVWPIDLPRDFTHARMNGKVFVFRNPNDKTDSYGYFLDGTDESFFSRFIELGKFSSL